MPVKPIPERFHSMTPYLVIEGAAKLIDFLVAAFDAKVIERMAAPDGGVAHAQLRIGDSMLMLGEARPEWPAMPGGIYLYVPDVDATFARALAAGAVSVMAPADQFYGDRQGGVKDPSGNLWWIATHVEDVAPDELRRRAEKQMGGNH